ncbi:MAG: amidase [Chloroflexota bacterium]|nr:amidase [Chloroflexota bacterium]MDE2885457.1 amidase [Chloroflexota bacterium]
MVQPTAVPIEQLGAADIVRGVTDGAFSPVDVIEAALDRIGAIEGKVQAWSLLDADGARAQAAAVTADLAAGKAPGPLAGVPVGIKDEFHVRGMPTGMRGTGELPIEPEDATCVARLRAAGAIIMGKTHLPVQGRIPPTRNPWNLEHTAGGTSSGSGAAVGARMVPVAIGEQTAGSNMRPAAYCGVAGIKPSYGRISRFGCMPFAWSIDHVGIIGLSVADLALVLSVIAGPDPRDPTTLPDPAPQADLDAPSIRPPRIGVVRNFFLERSEPVMRDAVEDATSRLKEAGAAVGDLLLPDTFGLTWHLHRIIGGAEGSTYHAADHDERALPGSGGRVGSLLPASYYVQARRIRSWLRVALAEMFADVDVMAMPTAPGPAPRGQSTGDAVLLRPWSLLGFPTVTVPCGLSPEGLPLGLQLVGAPRADYGLLRVSLWCEQALGRLPAPRV